MEVAEIQRSRLERAKRDLSSIADRHGGEFRSKSIDWRLIGDQLRRLDEAFQHQQGDVFAEALEMVVSRLSPPLDLRGRMDADPEGLSQPMPAYVLELVNHIFDKLNFDLDQSSEVKDGADDQKREVLDGSKDGK